MQTCPLLRDTQSDYKPLERLFATLPAGCAFGESCLTNMYEKRQRFYNAVALTECSILQLKKSDFIHIVEEQAKKSLNEKLAYLKGIPAFDSKNIPRMKLQHLCTSLLPFSCLKH